MPGGPVLGGVVMEPMNDAEQSYRQYKTEFAGTSLGTEEELGDTTIRTAAGAGQLIGYVQKNGDPLVQITRDLQVAEEKPSHGHYTIELRTTPTELYDKADWLDRRRALQVAIWAIDSSRGGKPLAEGTWRGYETVILNQDHQIMTVPHGGVAGAGQQSTVGVQAAGIGADSGQLNRGTGHLCPHLTLPWYSDEFAHDEAMAGRPAREQIGYALVISAIQQLATIWQRYTGKLTRLEVLSLLDSKNFWDVRPRTPPIRILDTFDGDGASLALGAILSREIPRKDLAGQWHNAVVHITKALPMGGHALPDSSIDGEPAMLFEYRHAPDQEYPWAFWQRGELTDASFPEHG